VQEQRFDVFCYHAAQVANYRSGGFDVGAALADNTLNLSAVLERLRAQGLKAVVATGTVFEQDEGFGGGRQAFSPYGLSKGLTWQVIRYWCSTLEIPLGKFVIANPFGPFEEERFCAHLINCWRTHKTALVRTPLYLRDNIHVDLLALAYANFVSDIVDSGKDARIGISGYRETQGAFAERMACEMRDRLALECRLELAKQTDFSEPLVRLNDDLPDLVALGWSETKAWDSLAKYYLDRIAGSANMAT
jgi:UDP-glucose 4-epimerase